MELRKHVEKCFGGDLCFAKPERVADDAFLVLVMCRARRIGWAEIDRRAVDFLTERGADPKHIAGEVAKMRSAMAHWLGE